MRTINKFVAVLMIPACLAASPALAQQARVVDESALTQALAGRAEAEQAQRARVQRVLDRDDVRAVAARMGLIQADAASAVATLSGADLDQAAQHAAAVESAALTGGSNTVVISTTTLLLILIIVILIAK